MCDKNKWIGLVGVGMLLGVQVASADSLYVNYYGRSPVYEGEHGHGYGHHKRHHEERYERCDDDDYVSYRQTVVQYEQVPVVRYEQVQYYQPEVRYEPAPQYQYAPQYQPVPQYQSAPTRYHSSTPMIVGGIVGGVLGNKVGKGKGRDVATVAGVLLGGSIGRDMGYRY